MNARGSRHRLVLVILSIFASHFSCLAQEVADDWDETKLNSSPSLKIDARIAEGGWKTGSLAVKTGTKVSLRVKTVSDAAKIRWFQLTPDISQYYKNANHPWESNPYKWNGFGQITYKRREIVAWRNQWEIAPISQEAFQVRGSAPHYRHDLGSFWLQAEVRVGDRRKRSAGLQENTDRNLSPSVFRLTIRKDDEYLGHLSGFFNVPGLFGSIPYQSSNYIGVDCADVLVAARQKWRGLGAAKDYNVAMLVNAWPSVAKIELERGNPKGDPVAWGKTVKPGDFDCRQIFRENSLPTHWRSLRGHERKRITG